MVKILSQAGISLAGTYDVEGSIAGVENLDANNVNLVHEMGATMFSERINSFISRVSTAALLQNVTFDLTITPVHQIPQRIYAIIVKANAANRIANVQLSITSTSRLFEIPIWTWNSAVDDEIEIRWDDLGFAIGAVTYLRSKQNLLPQMLIRMDSRAVMPDMNIRGLTSGFGAGNVTVVVGVLVARPVGGLPSGISSLGLPMPSW